MKKLSQESTTLRAMIVLYCRLHHGGDPLCADCTELWGYAEGRLARCPFGEEKPTCQYCPIHCYRPEMRQRVREVMRFSGPRMIWYHPLMAVRHLIHNSQSKRKQNLRDK